MLALTTPTNSSRADLTVSNNKLVNRGSDLATAAHLQIYCEAPAKPGDPVPEGRPSKGWWAQAYLGDDEPFGSRWWLLENVNATQETLLFAEEILREAFASWTRKGWASSVRVGPAQYVSRNGNTLLYCPVNIVAPDGGEGTFDAWAEVAG